MVVGEVFQPPGKIGFIMATLAAFWENLISASWFSSGLAGGRGLANLPAWIRYCAAALLVAIATGGRFLLLRHGVIGALTRRGVEMMQGGVFAKSDPGKGSTFTVILPRSL